MSAISEILATAAPVIDEAIKQRFEGQGHHLTGAWEDSIHAEEEGDDLSGYALSYGAIVDAGTLPDRIPFNGTGGDGSGRSKYIQGLYAFWKLRRPELTDKEALGRAFATAKKQKQEGMSTLGSRDYSDNKQRQHFIQEAFTENQTKIDNTVIAGFDNFINQQLHEEQVLTF